MNKKTMYIVVAVLVVVIVVAAAGVLLYYNGGGANPPSTTPTPAPATVTGATSVQFSVTETPTTGDAISYTFKCANYDTATEKIRVDMTIAGATYSYILDASQEKAWMSMDGTTWTASTFSSDWTTYGGLFNGFAQKLIDQGNTDAVTYTTDTGSVTISAVVVNEAIPDSTFAVS